MRAIAASIPRPSLRRSGGARYARRSMRLVLAATAGWRCLRPPRRTPARIAPTKRLRHLDVGIAAYRAGDFRDRASRVRGRARELVPDKANPYRWLGMT